MNDDGRTKGKPSPLWVECACIRDYAKSRDGVTERISLCLLFSLSLLGPFFIFSPPLFFIALFPQLTIVLRPIRPSVPSSPEHQTVHFP